ncbi:MAG: hypothetical protein U0359_05165 [Byssovorax sp.]
MRLASLAPLCAALLGLLGLGCASAGEAVRACPEGCPAGKSCVVGRCRAPDEPPSPTDTRRLFVPPAEVAVIASSAVGRSGAPLPETLALGRAGDGTVELLLRFVAPFRDDADVVSAFLVLDPLDGALPPEGGAPFETARILDPWQAATVSWGRQPRLSLPKLAGVIRPRAGSPVRVDVTALVRAWSERSPDDHGIALIVAGNDPVGGAYGMGITGGSGPRLEVYLR